MDTRVRVLGVGVGLTAALLFGGASAVQADPSGCSAPLPTLTFDSGNNMTVKGTASCSATSTRTWRVEIKYQKTLSPDPTVGGSSYTAATRSYSRSYTTCDDGAAHPYYGRSFFSTNTTYHDSATQDKRSCG